MPVRVGDGGDPKSAAALFQLALFCGKNLLNF
jgi:hypothetical protein